MKVKIIINILTYTSLLLTIACGPGIKQSELKVNNGTKTCQCYKKLGGKGLRLSVYQGNITIKSSSNSRSAAASVCKQKYGKYGPNSASQVFFVKNCR